MKIEFLTLISWIELYSSYPISIIILLWTLTLIISLVICLIKLVVQWHLYLFTLGSFGNAMKINLLKSSTNFATVIYFIYCFSNLITPQITKDVSIYIIISSDPAALFLLILASVDLNHRLQCYESFHVFTYCSFLFSLFSWKSSLMYSISVKHFFHFLFWLFPL